MRTDPADPNTWPRLRYPVSALVSYHYFRDPAVVAEYARRGLRLIGDSGAFSAFSLGAPIELDEYAEWARQVEDVTTWTASLDVIGDPDGTWSNWTTLRDRYGVLTVPTIHYPADPTTLDRYVAEGVDLIGLGGMVGLRGERDRLMRWCLKVHRYARDNHPHLRFHGWGVTHPVLIDNLPWFSVDSSGFGQAYIYGRISLFNPRTGKNEKANLNGRDVYRLSRLIRDVYNVDPDAIAFSNSSNRDLLMRVSGMSYQLQEAWLQARHRVTPPSMARDPHIGTTMHIVSTDRVGLRENIGTRLHAVPGTNHTDLQRILPDPPGSETDQ